MRPSFSPFVLSERVLLEFLAIAQEEERDAVLGVRWNQSQRKWECEYPVVNEDNIRQIWVEYHQ